MKHPMDDDLNRRLVAELLKEGRVSHAELAERMGVSRPTVIERVKRLEAGGILDGYAAKVSPAAVLKPVVAYVAVRYKAENDEALEQAFWRGLESAGVRGCGKHFPGHGDTRSDSHLDLPRIEAPLQRLREVELAPFAAAVAAGVGMIMTAHVVYGALDERPATMSRPCLDLLRRELGFDGVIVSDDLDMRAVAGRYPVRTIIREALAAGVDAFLACRDPAIQSQAAAALSEAATDPLLGAQVEAAIHRLGRFRAALAPARPASPEVRGQALPNPTHQALAARFAAMQRK